MGFGICFEWVWCFRVILRGGICYKIWDFGVNEVYGCLIFLWVRKFRVVRVREGNKCMRELF